MLGSPPIYISKETPEIQQHLEAIYPLFNKYELDKSLMHLVYLRASQMNKCAYCINMHTTDARNAGETNERLDHLMVWHQVDIYTEQEKVVFEWTEALTSLDKPANYALIRARLRAHFSDKEISILTANIAMINLWNRIGISAH